jgi:hypothetical protein
MGQVILSEEEQQFALDCFCEWAYIVENYSPPGRSVSSADIDHSSLLKRLLSGDRPFEFAPPKLYSYPCYELALGEKIQIEAPMRYSAANHPDCLIIGQNHLWEWYDKNKKIVTHTPSKRQFQLTVETDGHFLQLIGEPFEFMDDDE